MSSRIYAAMTTVDDFVQGFCARSNEEKEDAFEQSSLSLILQYLGKSSAWIDANKKELGPEFSCRWFNDLSLLHDPVFVKLCPSFNFMALFTMPHKSALIKLFKDFTSTDEECLACVSNESYPLVVFKVYKLGRVVVTCKYVPYVTHICVNLDDRSIYIYPFTKFFKSTLSVQQEF